ncbi:hypothetical protein [Halarchaeum sp. P4]|uniref:hypothetical protein n=1 Tax=Halarchaeum sp. P4 TaxID=3421639 RepID=UPI003EB791BC
MRPLAIAVGVILIGVAAYTVSDPMSRSRNWVSAAEWERDPERARAKQEQYALLAASGVGGLGVFLVLFGLVSG